jgi:hypothetical protein
MVLDSFYFDPISLWDYSLGSTCEHFFNKINKQQTQHLIMKKSLIILSFFILLALAAIKIGNNANWSVLIPQESQSQLTDREAMPYDQWSEEWNQRMKNGVTLSE